MYRHHVYFISEFNFGAKNLLTWSNDKKKKTLLEQEISSSDMKVLSKVSIINTMVCHIHI